MTGEEIARELINVLSVEYGVTVERVLAAMHDRAASNRVAMRTIKVLYPTIDHVGDHFKAPILDTFIHLWISLFAHSPRTWCEWKELTGKAMALYSDTRWWNKWEVFHQVLLQFGDVLPFLQAHPEFSPVTTAKLVQLMTDPQKVAYLQLQ